MAAEGGGKARQRSKDQERAKYLVAQGFYHGYRSYPWYQGINYPNLNHVGSAAYRRRKGGA